MATTIQVSAELKNQLEKRKIKKSKRPLLFAVIQGGTEIDLRKKCAQELVKIGFDGYSFGARHVDQNSKFLTNILKKTAQFIPQDSPRFALGVGTPEDIEKCVKLGWDMFDCVIPTREGRHGKLFVSNSKKKSININNSVFSKDFTIIKRDSKINGLKNHSRAYLKHLFQLKEPLGQKLAALNNLEFYQKLLTDLRK